MKISDVVDDFYDNLYMKIYEQNKEIERQKEIISQIKDIYTSLQFSAPENMYIFIEQLGEIFEKVEK